MAGTGGCGVVPARFPSGRRRPNQEGRPICDHVDITCGECGIPFCMPAARQRELKKTHETFYCPNGHPRHYPGKTEDDKRIEQLEARVDSLDRANDHAWEVVNAQDERQRALAHAAQVCPLGCEHRGTRRLAYRADEEELSRFFDRVGHDLAEHLKTAHHASPRVAAGLLGPGAPEREAVGS